MDRLRPLVVVPLALGTVAALMAFSAHTIVADQGAVSTFFDNRVYYAILVASVALCALRAAYGPDHRLAWALIAAGVAAWTAGDMYWMLRLADVEEPPFPSLSDAGYLAYFPLVYAGLLTLLRTRLRAAGRCGSTGLTAALAAGSVGRGAPPRGSGLDGRPARRRRQCRTSRTQRAMRSSSRSSSAPWPSAGARSGVRRCSSLRGS